MNNPLPAHNFPEMDCLNGIRGFLIDLDGVLYVGNRAVDGAVKALDFLSDNGYPFRCVSNTTRKCRYTIAVGLSAMDSGFRKITFSRPRRRRLRI